MSSDNPPALTSDQKHRYALLASVFMMIVCGALTVVNLCLLDEHHHAHCSLFNYYARLDDKFCEMMDSKYELERRVRLIECNQSSMYYWDGRLGDLERRCGISEGRLYEVERGVQNTRNVCDLAHEDIRDDYKAAIYNTEKELEAVNFQALVNQHLLWTSSLLAEIIPFPLRLGFVVTAPFIRSSDFHDAHLLSGAHNTMTLEGRLESVGRSLLEDDVEYPAWTH